MTAPLNTSNRPRRRVTRAGAGFLVQYAALGAVFGVAPVAAAQCQPTWSTPVGNDGGSIFALTAFDEDGPGPLPECLYAGGVFAQLGGVPANKIARYDGWRWSALGQGVTQDYVQIFTLLGIADGESAASPGLHMGGSFWTVASTKARGFARWHAGAWHVVEEWKPSGPSADVRSARLYPEPSVVGPPVPLIAGGVFQLLSLPQAQGLVQRSAAGWGPVGAEIYPAGVVATAVYDDDGPGPRPPGLYALGGFQSAGGVPANSVARWDGKNWEPLGSGIGGGPVNSLSVFDEDGPGPQREKLFVGGAFWQAGGVLLSGLACWDGLQWSAVPGWYAGWVTAMAVFDDDGPGPNKPALFVGGGIHQVAGMPSSGLVKWDGQTWSTLQGGVTGFPVQSEVKSLGVYDEDGAGPNPGGLYAGGYFFFTGTGIPAKGLARWGCPLPPECFANCTRDFDPVTGAHILSVADFGCFQGKYVLGDLYADCNASGNLTVADFGCFQGKYVLGCP